MACFSRKDANKEIFTRKITKAYNPNKQRINYNLLLDVKNGTVFCKNRNFTVDELCTNNRISQKCVLKTGEEVELNMSL